MEIERILAAHGVQFTPAQRQALSDDPAPALLLAVPGSGKTTVLVARTAFLLSRGTPPEEICSLTFSRNSAQDMRERFAALFGEFFPNPPRFSTIHSLCWRILREFSAQSGRPLPQLTGSELAPASDRLIREAYESLLDSAPDEETVSELAGKIGLCKNRLLSREEALKLDGMPDHFAAVYTRYEEEKKSRRLMDYDDLLLYALAVLQKRPAFRAGWQRRFRFWNVDECQDLTPAQFALLRTLVPEGRGLFLVGDEDQSIYGFRGADPALLLRLPEEYPGLRVLKMEDSHRARPELLALCEAFIRTAPDRYDKRLLPTRPPGGRVEQVFPKSMADAYGEIRALLSELPPGQTAGILYRSNLTACALSLFLQEQGIPFRLDAEPVTLVKHYTRAMAALLAVCADPFDLDSFHRSGCGRELGPLLYENVFLRADGTKPVPALLREAADRAHRPGRARLLADMIEEASRLAPGKALRLLETRTPAGRVIASRFRSGDPLIRLRYGQLRWICETSPDFPALLRRLTEASRPAAYRPGEASLTLSTVHSAKGLEFDMVILFDCFEGILPARGALSGLTLGEEAAFREEQRLFYVAATRARERIVLFDPPADWPGFRLSRFGYAFLSPAKEPQTPVPFREGDRLFHRAFGEGRLIKRSGEEAEILFDRWGMKHLNLAHCIRKNLVSRI